MTSLALRLQKQHVKTSLGAVATLQRVADESGAAVQQGRRLDLVIPAGPDFPAVPDDTGRVSVDPGRWLVEATLPSGEVITQDVAVAKGQDVAVTLYAAEHSPHEWLGWQHLTGNVEGAETLERIVRTSAKPRAADALSAGLERLGTGVTTAEPPAVHLDVKQGSLHGIAAWSSILEFPLAPATPGYSHAEEDASKSTRLYYLGPAQSTERQFAHVEWLGKRFTVSLPLPWQTVKTLLPVRAQMMVRLHPVENNVQIGVIVEDPGFAMMAGLMTASTLPKAVVAVRQARDMLFSKMENPLAAAAGGYVLLAAGDSEERYWHGWIDNLSQRFPAIPDGAILQASLRLRFPRSSNSAAEARTALLDAFERGIPYYSAGVSWLLDGLTTFADDPAVEEKMRIVQRVAFRLDLSQAFTVVRIITR